MQMSCTDQIRYVSSVYLSKEAESRENSDHTYWELQNGLNIFKRVYRERYMRYIYIYVVLLQDNTKARMDDQVPNS